MHKSFLYLLCGCGWLVLVTILLCLPGSAFPQESWFDKFYVDKLVHAFLFCVLMLWFAFFLREARLPNAGQYLLWIFLAAAAYGFVMELVQKWYIPHRAFDIRDFVADSVGAWLGYRLFGRQVVA